MERISNTLIGQVRVYEWKERKKGKRRRKWTCKEEMFRKFFVLVEYLHVRFEVLTVVTYEEYCLL
jgi:hypothetical protein